MEKISEKLPPVKSSLSSCQLPSDSYFFSSLVCYQCGATVSYLFADSRGKCCTRLTVEAIQGVL